MATDKALEVALQGQNEINVDRIISEMKGSALANSNWEQLLSSAPVALRCLGACFMAASDKGTVSVKVPKVPGATLERPEYLSDNLVRCSNIGKTAFLTANTGMTKIYQLSGMAENKVYDIMDVLGNPRAAAKQLPLMLRQLQDSAEKCYKVSKDIDNDFHSWLLFTSELHEACQSRSSNVTDEQAKAITDKAIASARLTGTEKQVTDTKAAMSELGKTMDAARVAYTKASNSQPSGWDLVGQQLVGALGECLTTGINLALPALVDNLNPIAKAKAAGGILADLKDGKKDTKNTTQGTSSTDKGSTSNGNNQGTEPASNAVPDPGLAYVKKDMWLFDQFKAIVKNRDGDIDWNSASGVSKDSSSAAASSGLAFVEGMLADSKQYLSKQKATGTATTTYLRVLGDALKLAGEIVKAAKEATSSISAERPKKESEIVIKWQTAFDGIYKDMVALGIAAQSLPYNPASSAGGLTDPTLQAAKINAQSTQAQALLASAAKNLETTSKTLTETTKVYGETQKMLSEQQSNLAEINASIARLTSATIELEESKKILIRCIALIIELKARITDLVNFFSSLAAVVETVSTTLVKQWLENVSSAVTSDSAALSKGMLKIGAYTLETAERTMIMHGSITIGAYFSFFADIAKGWNTVSSTSIFPGIEMAESLSLPGDAQAKMQRLESWSNEAQETIKTVLGKQREEIQNGMQSRIEEVRGQIKQLPPNLVPSAIMDVANKQAEQIAAAQVGALQQDANNSAVAIISGKRRAF